MLRESKLQFILHLAPILWDKNHVSVLVNKKIEFYGYIKFKVVLLFFSAQCLFEAFFFFVNASRKQDAFKLIPATDFIG